MWSGHETKQHTSKKTYSISEMVVGEVALNVLQVLQLMRTAEVNRVTYELVQGTLLSLKSQLVIPKLSRKICCSEFRVQRSHLFDGGLSEVALDKM